MSTDASTQNAASTERTTSGEQRANRPDRSLVRGAEARRAVPVDLTATGPARSMGPVGPWADELDRSRKLAEREGYAIGHSEGRAEGLRRVAADIEAERHVLAQTIDQLMVELQDQIDSAIAAIGEQTATLAVEIAAMILDREVTVATSPGAEAIARCLAVAPHATELRARVHPDQIAAVEQVMNTTERRVQVIADPTLGLGDAMVHADDATIDGRIGAALARVAEVLL